VKLSKGLQLLARPRLAVVAARQRVAAATEHLSVIRLTAANTLFDVGANKGQFSLAFRALRPSARIVAFEPLPAAADRYESVFAGDPHVTLERVALATAESTATFNVTDREDSSSLLKPGARQADAFGVHFAREITVPVRRLDHYTRGPLAGPVLLKIDVQGGELDVLSGCADLAVFDFIYVELSFLELYEGQPLFQTVSDWLGARGFHLAGVYNQAESEAEGPLQADALFARVAR